MPEGTTRPLLVDTPRPLLVDTHCHLDAVEFDVDRADVLAAAGAAGVGAVVVPAVERANFAAVASLCRSETCCAPAWGIHPLYVDTAQDEDLDALRATLACETAVAVGEIGLDRFVAARDDARQARFFSAQLHLAREFDLPVILHVRRAVDQVLAQLRAIRVCGGIAHAFNGSAQQAAQFIELGFKLGFGGAMTYPRSLRIRALAAQLPLDAIVLETDAPDIPPAWQRGERNSPEQLPRIAAVLADLRATTLADIMAQTSANACAALPRLRHFFPPPPHSRRTP